MRAIVLFERSGVVRRALERRGVDAVSVDILPARDMGAHIQADIDRDLERLVRGFPLVIAFPPCTDIAVSGAHCFKEKIADGRQALAIARVKRIAQLPNRRIAIENPIGVLSTHWRKPDQIIQPYQFGENASKRTCLWLKNLPPLAPTLYIAPRWIAGKPRWANQTDSGQNRLAPSEHRAEDRARTYAGIAAAMARQWFNCSTPPGGYLRQKPS